MLKLAICNFWRRPLLPLLLVIFLTGGVCCLALFQSSIERNRQTIEELYENIQLRYRVLPGNSSSGGALRLPYYAGRDIGDMPEVISSYGIMETRYSLCVPESASDLSVAYGTGEPDWFAGERELTITYADGWDGTDFQIDAGSQEVPCIMDSYLQELLGMELGEAFSIKGYQTGEGDGSNAPEVPLILAGSFENSSLETMSLIVPEALFLEEQGLLHTSHMKESNLHYTEFWFELKPEYNHNFAQIEAQVSEVLEKRGDYLLYGNTRELTNAVQPLERKVEFQQKLVLPMAAAFCMITMLAGLLYALSLREECFLRLLWGEKRQSVLSKNFLCLCVPVLLGSVLGLGIVLLLPECRRSIAGLSTFLAVCAVSSILTAELVTLWICKSNLIYLYQQREE